MHLPGYRLTETLYRGADSLVVRGECEEDGLSVVIKSIAEPDGATRAHCRHEFAMQRAANGPGVSRALKLVEHVGSQFLVAEDLGGQSLDRVCAEQPMAVPLVLELTMRACAALDRVHKLGMLHLDICPDNLVWNQQDSRLQLIDFGSAAYESVEVAPFCLPTADAQRFWYMAPEQTGRMNQPVDYRADYYSLGATMYHLLTGQPPFRGDDALAVIDCQLSVAPTPMERVAPWVPPAVATVIATLMAKNPDHRYHSAHALEMDLRRLRPDLGEPSLGSDHGSAPDTVADTAADTVTETLSVDGPTPPFQPRRRDVRERFQIAREHYGRTRERFALMQAFERIASDDVAHKPRPELVLIAGEAGAGKNALARSLYPPLTRRRGLFASGRFEPLQPGRAYSALVSAFRALLRQLTSDAWASALSSALGPDCQVLTRAIPELSAFVGAQPAIPPALKPEANRNRFHLVFFRLIAALARPEHPLVLFLDELQWADSASLELLRQFVTRPSEDRVLIVAAYRSQEVGPKHPLRTTLEELRAADVPMRELHPQPLTLEHLTRMLMSTLDSDDNSVRPLAESMLRITGGNPFFAHEYLHTLHEQGLLSYRAEQRQWHWNVAEIVWRDLSDQVESFVAANMQHLSEPTQRLLRLAACLGHRFSVTGLAMSAGRSLDEIRELLAPAIAAGFVRAPVQCERFDEAERMQFRHPLVRQAAMQLFTEPTRRALHLHIGRVLLAERAAGAETAFVVATDRHFAAERVPLTSIVSHLNMGRRFLLDPAERVEIARLNLRASERAVRDSAFVEAEHYLETAEELLGEQRFVENYPIARDLSRARAEVAYLAGDYRGACIHADRAITSLRDGLDRGEMRAVLLAVHQRRGEYELCLAVAAVALAELDEPWPDDARLEDALAERYTSIQKRLESCELKSVLERPVMSDARAHLCDRLLALATPAAVHRGLSRFAFVVFRRFELMIAHGPGSQAPALLTMYGQVLHAGYDQSHEGLAVARLAIGALERAGLQRTGCHTYDLTANWLLPWCEPLARSLELNQRGYRFGLAHGDIERAGTIAIHDIWLRLYAGTPLQTAADALAPAQVCSQQAGNKYALDHLRALNLLVRMAIGDATFGDKRQRVSGREPGLLAHLQAELRFSALVHYHIASAFLSYIHGDHQRALRACTRARVLSPYLAGHIASAFLDVYESLARAALYPQATSDEKAAHWQALRANYQRISGWAERGPANLEHLRHLLSADMERISGALERAADGYRRAAALAREHDFAHHEAVAHEQLGRLYLRLERTDEARRHLLGARLCYRLWGARGKVGAWDEEFSELLSPPLVSDIRADGDESPPESALAPGAHHVPDRIGATCRAMIGELELSGVIELAIEAAVTEAGAERGLLILDGAVHSDSSPYPNARWTSERDGRARAVPVADYPWVAADVLAHVASTHATVLLDDARQDKRFQWDPYLQRFAVRSLICLPLCRVTSDGGRDEVAGYLYLEDNRTDAEFRPDCLPGLRALAQHLVIAADNAHRYKECREQVLARTREVASTQVELRTALDHLETAQDNLLSAEKLASLGRISAGIAHELKNPLNFVVNFSEMAAELAKELATVSANEPEAKLSGIGHDLADLQVQTEQISKHAQRANSIIHGMMQHAGRMSSHREQVAINELVEQHVKLAISAPAIAERARAITIERNYDPDAGHLTLSALEVGQVILNLVNNAFYAVLDRHSSAHVADDYRPTVTLTTQRNADRVVIRVGDNGTGIPAKIQPKIFEPFYTTKPPGEGTGLGLSLSHDIIVQGHGGVLAVESEHGVHTDFIIELPTDAPDSTSD